VLRDALAQAEKERAAAAKTLEAEVGALRERLVQAQREAQECVSARATLQAEIAALQGTLDAARQVGKATLAALQLGSSAPTKPDGPRGWRRAVMRFFGADARW
jgi:predicted  nucleic acid-binding Zn-ribbon protein